MRIRFLEDTNIRPIPDSRSGKPLGVLHKGSEIEVENTMAHGEAINNNNRWYLDKNGWYYWSGKIDVIELPVDPPPIIPDLPAPVAVQSTFPVFPLIPPGPGAEKIPEGETRRVPSAASFQLDLNNFLVTLRPATDLEMRPRGLNLLPIEMETGIVMPTPTSSAVEVLDRTSDSEEDFRQVIASEKLNWAVRKYAIEQEWWQKKGLTGKDIKVALLSTGVAIDHPDLSAIVDWFQYPDPGKPMQDVHGLGTQAAVLCAGRGNTVFGIAPEAQFLIAKIGAFDQAITPDGLLAGLDWALRSHADIIAMLVDFPEFSPTHTEKMKMLVQQALDRQVLLVAPVGNSDGRKPETRYPSGFEGVLSVGAHNQHNLRSSFSARSYHLDLLAPGEGLLTSDPNGQPIENIRSVALATTFVAGFLALVCQGLRRRGYPSGPDTVFPLLRETAVARRNFNPGQDVEFGYGILDPSAVLKRIEEELS